MALVVVVYLTLMELVAADCSTVLLSNLKLPSSKPRASAGFAVFDIQNSPSQHY
jgi:hypothetical protein